MNRYEDCSCEDYPCCGHFDSVEAEPSWCDCCGMNHSPFLDCDEDDDDDGYDELGMPTEDWHIPEDRHLDASYEDRFAMEDN